MYSFCVIIRILEEVLLMAKSRTSAAVKNRYAAKAYDRVQLIVPKGRKADIEAHAAARGDSVNGYISGLVQADMGMSDEAWKQPVEDPKEE